LNFLKFYGDKNLFDKNKTKQNTFPMCLSSFNVSFLKDCEKKVETCWHKRHCIHYGCLLWHNQIHATCILVCDPEYTSL